MGQIGHRGPITDPEEMLTPEECAKRMRISKRTLLRKARGRRPLIPAFRLNDRVIRFHWPTVVARLSGNGG